MNCWVYRIYDRLKSTWLVSKVFYRGGRFTHRRKIRVAGTVVDCVHGSTDGDYCFDVQALTRYHCELTPCQSKTLHALAQMLKQGMRVQVDGISTWDPPHWFFKSFDGGGNEIHPVTNIHLLDIPTTKGNTR